MVEAAARRRVEVVAVHPHDASAWTQGLLEYQGRLYESTGLRGQSSLREVELESGSVQRRVALPADIFGEGLARVDERLYVLSWTSGIVRIHDLRSFALLDQRTYDTQGWGLCFDGARLIMSDGSDTLYFRDPDTFEEIGRVSVRLDGDPVSSLNELECVDGKVFANVWQTDLIMEIDPSSGRVLARIDAGGLLSAPERAGADVLNGIAYLPSRGTFALTGKLWPRLFEVRFVDF